MATTVARLAAVQTAIDAMVSNNLKSYTIDGRTFTRNSIGELRRLEKDLQRQYNEEQGVKPRVSFARFGRAAE